jgi:hypothetical protein
VRSLLKTTLVCVCILAWAGVLSAQTTTTTTTTTTTATPNTPPPPAPFPNAFNQPPCDFSNTFYEENGVLALANKAPLNSRAAGRFGLFRLTGPPASSFNGGTENWVNDSTCPVNNPDTTNTRILATTGAYKDDDGSPTLFFSLIAFILNQNFFNQGNFTLQEGDNTVSITNSLNPRGFNEQFLVGNFEAYGAPTQRIANGTLAPTPCGSLQDPAVASNDCFPLGINPSNGFQAVETPNLRQDWRIASNRNAIDGSSNGPGSPFGYFCDDLLGAWIVTYFWWTQNTVGGTDSSGHAITPTATCNTVRAQAASVNGTDLDGTPIIHTGNELHFIEGVPGTAPQFGFSSGQASQLLSDMAVTGPCGAEGNLDAAGGDGGAVWLSCPTILDPRNGAVAQDAFPDVVFTSSGAALDPRLINNFKCLQKTGLFCDGT